MGILLASNRDTTIATVKEAAPSGQSLDVVSVTEFWQKVQRREVRGSIIYEHDGSVGIEFVLAKFNYHLSSCFVLFLLPKEFSWEVSNLERLPSDFFDYLVEPFTAEQLQAKFGEMVRFSQVINELFQLVTAEGNLHKQEFKLGNTDFAPCLLWTSDANGGLNYVNDAWLAFTGRQPKDEVGYGWAELTHPADVNKALKIYNTSFRNRMSYNMRYRLLRHDGHYRWLEEWGHPRYLPNGTFSGFIGMAMDITDKRQAEEVLRVNGERVQALVDSMPGIVWSAQSDGNIDYLNQRWYDFSGFRPVKGEPFPFLRLLHPDDRKNFTEQWFGSVRTGEPSQIEHRLLDRKTKEYLWFQTRAVPVRNVRGVVERWFGATSVIDQWRRSEKHVHYLAERLGQIDRLKDEFLMTISHELRTPLSVIMGNLDLLAIIEPGTPNYQVQFQAIERNAKQLERLVNDLLDVSTIIKGKMTIALQPTNVGQIIDTVVHSFKPATTSKALRVEVAVDEDLPKLPLDAGRIQQALWNLVGNAVKFTPEHGYIKIVAVYSDQHLEISVEDSGRGIDSGFLPYIFERFTTADSSLTRVHGGVGLGLTIVRHIVELHGGTVKAESRGLGQGAKFTIVLPIANVPAKTA